ncbi:MAG TPA: polysaccharide biosynthesis/export family protein [Verrucomicrobiae bacterium]|jgi:protein involved in polysaccharide export with SLBB domain/capsular polysaccharide biosynthesis protein
MNQNEASDFDALSSAREEEAQNFAQRRVGTSGGAGVNEQAAPAGPSSSRTSTWVFIELFVKRWVWLLLGGAALAAAAWEAGMWLLQTHFTAVAQLIYYESPNVAEVFRPRQITLQTLASQLRAPELLERVGAKAEPPLSAEGLAANSRVVPERGAEVVTLSVTGTNLSASVELANLYAREAVRYTQEIQGKDAAEIDRYVKQQLAQIDAEVSVISQQLRSLPRSALQSAAHPAQLSEKLQSAREELAALQGRYTDAHPAVQAQQAKVAALEKFLAGNGTGANGTTASGEAKASNDSNAGNPVELKESDLESLTSRLHVLLTGRLQLVGRQRAAQEFAENAPGFFRVLAPASPKEVIRHDREVKVAALSVLAGIMGVFVTACLILLVELTGRHLKNAADVERVTQLPLLATLGDLDKMEPSQQAHWAFRTWTILQGRLSHSPNHGLVCGFISSERGEGRSTWVNLLARAASAMGFRVLTIATQPTTSFVEDPHAIPKEIADKDQFPPTAADAPTTSALTRNVLTSPTDVTQKLVGPHSQPVVHIPLPGWVWNLERRKQWQAALENWRAIDNIVILVELPPASVPESVLLGENVPQVVWLTASGEADAAQTREHLELLRHARCNLVGAVLNHAPNHALKKRFARWLACVALGGAITQAQAQQTTPTSAPAAAGGPLPPALAVVRTPQTVPAEPGIGQIPAAENTGRAIAWSMPVSVRAAAEAPAVQTNLSLASIGAPQRAAWQQRLTLGPGDVLNFSLFGSPELARSEVLIGPDGRVSYLQAHDILAAGLTIDELRAKFDEELAKYHRTPRTLITPAAYHSKKFFMLGTVVQKGVFPLDRPMSIIEAVAQGRGLETGLFGNNTRELADLSRSFLVRQGKRMPVDFEKLFQSGDLSQNIALEPDDYLFFPPTGLQEVYVLGEVKLPGPVGYNPGLGAVAAISQRGGFTDRAWNDRILIVRGSLNRPEPWALDAKAVLSARALDFALQPKDIIYVSHRPWIKAEELLDAAATSFVQAAVIVWTGQNVGTSR